MKKSTLAREEKMNMIQEKLEAGTKEIFTTEKYKTYISTMAKFPEYSINNCILIASQCPTATLVCGYKKWQSEFHRTVNKNEHGIMIIAPVKYKADVEELVYDENSKPVLDEMGKQKKKIVNREFQSFRPAYVFDVQQTSGEPLPTLATMLEESVEGYEQLKEALILISPVQVSFESIEGSANGYYSPAEEKIVVGKDLMDFDYAKDKIIMVAVNAEKNKELLADVPYQLKEDLALIYKVKLGTNNEEMATVTIHNNLLKTWGATKEEIHELAMKNTRELLPVTIRITFLKRKCSYLLRTR